MTILIVSVFLCIIMMFWFLRYSIEKYMGNKRKYKNYEIKDIGTHLGYDYILSPISDGKVLVSLKIDKNTFQTEILAENLGDKNKFCGGYKDIDKECLSEVLDEAIRRMNIKYTNLINELKL